MFGTFNPILKCRPVELPNIIEQNLDSIFFELLIGWVYEVIYRIFSSFPA